MVEKVVLTAQKELFTLYEIHKSDVWFDFEVADRYGRGRNGSPKSLRFYIYSREHPKSKDTEMDRPWQEGDVPLWPYEDKPKKTVPTKRKVKQTDWLTFDTDYQRDLISQFLNAIFDTDEAAYYLQKIDDEQRSVDTYSQVLQVLYEKQRQPKFSQGTKRYKQKSLREFVFATNLKNYGWSIEPYQP